MPLRGKSLIADGQCMPDALIALSGGAKVRASRLLNFSPADRLERI